MKILVLEDNTFLHSALKRLLSNHTVVCVTTCAEAIKELMATQYDVVSLDYNLGNETSMLFADFLCELEVTSRPKTFIHSSDTTGVLRLQQCLFGAGISAPVISPVDLLALL